MLPNDTARCAVPCDRAKDCARTDPGHPTYQAVAHYPGGQSCPGFIERDER